MLRRRHDISGEGTDHQPSHVLRGRLRLGTVRPGSRRLIQELWPLQATIGFNAKKSKEQPPATGHKIEGVYIDLTATEVTLRACPERVKYLIQTNQHVPPRGPSRIRYRPETGWQVQLGKVVRDVSTVPTCVWYQLSHLQANQGRTPCDTPPQLEILPVIYTDCRSVPDRRQSYSAAPSLSRDTYLHNSQLEAWAAMTSPVVFRLSLRLAPAHPNLKTAWGLINSWTAAQPTWHSVLH